MEKKLCPICIFFYKEKPNLFRWVEERSTNELRWFWIERYWKFFKDESDNWQLKLGSKRSGKKLDILTIKMFKVRYCFRREHSHLSFLAFKVKICKNSFEKLSYFKDISIVRWVCIKTNESYFSLLLVFRIEKWYTCLNINQISLIQFMKSN